MKKPYILTVALNAAVDTTYLLDGFGIGGIHAAAEVQRAAGGKANNVARVLRLLEVPVVATGFAGGRAGSFIQGCLREQGIRVAFVEIAGESRTCLALVDRQGRTLTEVREKGPGIAASDADAFRHRFLGLLGEARAVVLSGSLPPGLPAAFYAGLVSAVRRADGFSVLDASGTALQLALDAQPNLVKPNREELAAWAEEALPDVESVRCAAHRMRSAGAVAVAVSLGAEGLVYTGLEGDWLVRPPAVEPVNTVGSGDSLVAGLLAGVQRGLPMPEALRLGVACGTANALTAGVAAPERTAVDGLLPLVMLERLP